MKRFLGEHWPPAEGAEGGDLKAQAVAFRRRAIEAGYVARSIPKRYGGSEQPADPRRGYARFLLSAAVAHPASPPQARAGPGSARFRCPVSRGSPILRKHP